jgi:hypothetical protein
MNLDRVYRMQSINQDKGGDAAATRGGILTTGEESSADRAAVRSACVTVLTTGEPSGDELGASGLLSVSIAFRVLHLPINIPNPTPAIASKAKPHDALLGDDELVTEFPEEGTLDTVINSPYD